MRKLSREEKACIKGLTVADLVREALSTDGAHHKQWYLEMIALLIGIELPDEGEYEEGIAP